MITAHVQPLAHGAVSSDNNGGGVNTLCTSSCTTCEAVSIKKCINRTAVAEQSAAAVTVFAPTAAVSQAGEFTAKYAGVYSQHCELIFIYVAVLSQFREYTTTVDDVLSQIRELTKKYVAVHSGSSDTSVHNRLLIINTI